MTKNKIISFLKPIKEGLILEAIETLHIPKNIINKEYSKAFSQIINVFKMTFIAAIWLVPGGALITAFILKTTTFFHPSSFK